MPKAIEPTNDQTPIAADVRYLFDRIISEPNRIEILNVSPPIDPRMRQRCRCGALEGELHRDNCLDEFCPLCGQPLMQCECESNMADACGIDVLEDTDEYDAILLEVDRRRKEAGRVPFVHEPHMCARCGRLWPTYFRVNDWQAVIPPPLRDKILCFECYALVRSYTLAGQVNAGDRDQHPTTMEATNDGKS